MKIHLHEECEGTQNSWFGMNLGVGVIVQHMCGMAEETSTTTNKGHVLTAFM